MKENKKKKITPMKVTSVKMRYQNSLNTFEFELKTNIGDINNSSSDDEEEGAEYKVKRISNSEWYECSAKAVVGRCSSK